MAQVLSLLHTLTGDFDTSFVGVAAPLCISLLEDVGARRLIDKRLCDDHLYAVAAMQLVTARIRNAASAELSAKVRTSVVCPSLKVSTSSVTPAFLHCIVSGQGACGRPWRN